MKCIFILTPFLYLNSLQSQEGISYSVKYKCSIDYLKTHQTHDFIGTWFFDEIGSYNWQNF